MGKARLGSLTDKYQSEFWRSLFEDLQRAVLANKIACPELEFQRDEAEFDKRIEHAVWQVICELSLGLEFQPYESILEAQIEEAAFRFLGKNPPRREPWSLAFKSDPQGTVETRMDCDAFGVKHRIEVHLFSPSGEVVDHDRELKKRWVNHAKSLLKQPTSGDWNKELLVQKAAVIDSFLGSSAFNIIARLQASDNWLDKSAASWNRSKLKGRLARLEEIGITPHNVEDFFKSDELLNTPFIDIFCSIDTVIVQNNADRTPKGGDLRDVAILATVLPYSDVVTTDRFMKDILVNHLRFDEKYQCEIFSATKEDRLAFQ